jgi:hypothetical protein
MGTRIPTVPYSTPKLDALLERDASVGGRPPSDDDATRRARMKRGTNDAIAAPLGAHPLIYAAAAGGVALVFAASLGGSKATRIAALAAVGIGAVAFVIARRPLRLASLLEQAKAEVLGAP